MIAMDNVRDLVLWLRTATTEQILARKAEYDAIWQNDKDFMESDRTFHPALFRAGCCRDELNQRNSDRGMMQEQQFANNPWA